MHRFKLFLNFNTAKVTYRRGEFRVKVMPDAEALGEGVEIEKEKVKEKEEEAEGVRSVGSGDTVMERTKVSTAAYDMATSATIPGSSSTVALIDIPPSDSFAALEKRLSKVEERVEEIELAPVGKEDPFKVSFYGIEGWRLLMCSVEPAC